MAIRSIVGSVGGLPPCLQGAQRKRERRRRNQPGGARAAQPGARSRTRQAERAGACAGVDRRPGAAWQGARLARNDRDQRERGPRANPLPPAIISAWGRPGARRGKGGSAVSARRGEGGEPPRPTKRQRWRASRPDAARTGTKRRRSAARAAHERAPKQPARTADFAADRRGRSQ